MDTEDSNLSSNDNECNDGGEAPYNWSREDKYAFLQALKVYDCKRTCERVQLMLPSKTTSEISKVIQYYKNKATEHPMVKSRVKKDRKAVINSSQVPLTQWAKLLTDTYTFKELQTETATAMRLIANFGNIPQPAVTGGINFREVYNAVANAMEGKALPDDKLLNAVLEKCITETAYASKSFIRTTAFIGVIQDINLSDKEISVFPRPTNNHELSTLRHLASQRRYNPYNISERYLKPSLHDYTDVDNPDNKVVFE